MHREENIIQPIMSFTRTPLYKRYFRFSKHSDGWFRSAVFVTAVVAIMITGSIRQNLGI